MLAHRSLASGCRAHALGISLAFTSLVVLAPPSLSRAPSPQDVTEQEVMVDTGPNGGPEQDKHWSVWESGDKKIVEDGVTKCYFVEDCESNPINEYDWDTVTVDSKWTLEVQEQFQAFEDDH